MTSQAGNHEPPVGALSHMRVVEIGDQVLGARPLDLEGADVDLVDVDVEAAAEVHALQPQHEIRIREREPELVVGHAQHHRVVEDYALGAAFRGITKFARASAPGPATRICRSTATSHIVTRSTKAWYSAMVPPSSGFT